jgi:large subunit ribosomal protein L29
MKTADIRSKTPDQLKQDLLDLRKEQFNYRFQKTSGQLENTARVRTVRRNVARIKTILAETESGKSVVAKAPKKVVKAAAPVKKKKESKE